MAQSGCTPVTQKNSLIEVYDKTGVLGREYLVQTIFIEDLTLIFYL